eukprot:scaffold6795_cov114-Isochrysis_galbana.AAC.2
MRLTSRNASESHAGSVGACRRGQGEWQVPPDRAGQRDGGGSDRLRLGRGSGVAPARVASLPLAVSAALGLDGRLKPFRRRRLPSGHPTGARAQAGEPRAQQLNRRLPHAETHDCKKTNSIPMAVASGERNGKTVSANAGYQSSTTTKMRAKNSVILRSFCSRSRCAARACRSFESEGRTLCRMPKSKSLRRQLTYARAKESSVGRKTRTGNMTGRKMADTLPIWPLPDGKQIIPRKRRARCGSTRHAPIELIRAHGKMTPMQRSTATRREGGMYGSIRLVADSSRNTSYAIRRLR